MQFMHGRIGIDDEAASLSLDQETMTLLRMYNPHWAGASPLGHLEQVFPRDTLDMLRSYADDRQMVVLSGPRRAGKTVLLKQMMAELVAKGVDPRRMLYFSFDGLVATDHMAISKIVGYFKDNVLPSKPSKVDRAYLFLDEIQFVPYWPTMLKRFYETEPHMKMFVSGSSALEVRRDSRESLAGRRFDFTVHPLSFREYLRFKGIEVHRLDWSDTSGRLPGMLDMRMDEIRRHLSDYMLRGGYPETVGMAQASRVCEYLRHSVLEKVVYRDLPEVEGVRDPTAVMQLVQIAASISSRAFEIGNVGSAIGVDRNRASAYVSMLERAGLVSVSYNLTRSKVKAARTSKRLYMADTGMMSCLLGYDSLLTGPELGRLAETAAYNHLSRTGNAYFWRDARGNEVDIVLTERADVVPIEVKYQTNITKADAKGLARFCETHRNARPVMITRDQAGSLEVGGFSVRLVPMWRALLAV